MTAPGRGVSLGELDKLVDARKCPDDFWACVQAADDARARGDDSILQWPSGAERQSIEQEMRAVVRAHVATV